MNEKWIYHFGIKLKNKNLYMNRDYYSIPTDKPTDIKLRSQLYNKYKKYIQFNTIKDSIFIKIYKKRIKAFEEAFTDETCSKYKQDYVDYLQEANMENYDLNIKYYESLDKEDFQKEINKLLKKHKKLKEVTDINLYDNKSGIYILILDKYKQIYIGQSNNIKKRIVSHWLKNKEFDRLIFMSKEKSVLSIDSFRALDTTRIFIQEEKNYDKMMNLEKELTEEMPKKYISNRTIGGERFEDISSLYTIANANQRDFKRNN